MLLQLKSDYAFSLILDVYDENILVSRAVAQALGGLLTSVVFFLFCCCCCCLFVFSLCRAEMTSWGGQSFTLT